MVETSRRTTSLKESAEAYNIDRSTPEGLAAFQARFFEKNNPKLASNYRTLADNYDQLLEVAEGKYVVIVNGEIAATKKRLGGEIQMVWKIFNTSEKAQAYVSAKKLTGDNASVLIAPILREVKTRERNTEETKPEDPIRYVKKEAKRRNF